MTTYKFTAKEFTSNHYEQSIYFSDYEKYVDASADSALVLYYFSKDYFDEFWTYDASYKIFKNEKLAREFLRDMEVVVSFKYNFPPENKLTDEQKIHKASLQRFKAYVGEYLTQYVGLYASGLGPNDDSEVYDNIKTRTTGEKKALKELGKLSKKTSGIVLKSENMVSKEFESIKNYTNKHGENIVKAFKRFENNEQKVGNVFTSNLAVLKSDFEKNIRQREGYKLVDFYYNDAQRYGLDSLALNTIKCLARNIPNTELLEFFEKKQKEIEDFLKNSGQFVAETFNIADQLIGITEEARDFGAKFIQNFSDFRSQFERIKIPTKNDAIVNNFRKRILSSIVPVIITTSTSLLNDIVNNICDEDEVGTFSFDDIPDLQDMLKKQYGVDSDSLDDLIAMLVDIAGFLTKLELCSLFNGTPSDKVLGDVVFFINSFYTNASLYLNTKDKVQAFFVFVGSLIPDKDEFCADVISGAFADEPCNNPSSYAGRLRACVLKRDKDKIEILKKDFISSRFESLERIINLTFYPKDARLDQKEILEAFKEEESRRRLQGLLNIVDNYEVYYKNSIKNLKNLYNFNFDLNESAEALINSVFAPIENDPDSTINVNELDRIKKQFLKLYEEGISKVAKQINPELERFILLDHSEIRKNKTNNTTFFQITKQYKNLDEALRSVRYTADSISKISENTEFYSYNPAIRTPGYQNYFNWEFSPFDQTRQNKFGYSENYYINVIGQSQLVQVTTGVNKNKFERVNIPFSEQLTRGQIYVNQKSEKIDKSRSLENFLDTKIDLYNQFKLDKKTKEDRYQDEFQSTYNQLAKICYNSIYSRKIPIGPNRSFDSTKLSTYDYAYPYYPSNDVTDCGNIFNSLLGSLKFKDMVNFKEEARIVSRVDMEDYLNEFPTLERSEENERKRYLNLLLKFKMHIASFVLKSLQVFTEFDFKVEQVDDLIKDFLYVEIFRKLVEQDAIDERTSLNWRRVSKKGKEEFLKKIRYYDFALKLDQDLAKKAAKTEVDLKNETARLEGQIKQFTIDINKKVKSLEKFILNGKITIDGTSANTFKDVLPNLKTGAQITQVEAEKRFKTIKSLEDKIKKAVRDKNNTTKDLGARIRFYQSIPNIFQESDEYVYSFDKRDSLFIDDTYEITKVLLYHHNEVEEGTTKTDDFCVAIRNLISFEVPRIGKRLKEIIYPKALKDQTEFDIDLRYILEKLNILLLPDNVDENDYQKMVELGMDHFFKTGVSFDFPYYRNQDYSTDYIEDKLTRSVYSQLGSKYFLLTTAKRNGNKLSLKTRKVFFLPPEDKKGLKSLKIKEEKHINSVYGKIKEVYDKGPNGAYIFPKYPHTAMGAFFMKWKDDWRTDLSFLAPKTYKQQPELGTEAKDSKYFLPWSTGPSQPQSVKEFKEKTKLLKQQNISRLKALSGERPMWADTNILLEREYDIQNWNNRSFFTNYKEKYDDLIPDPAFEEYMNFCIRTDYLLLAKKELFTNKYGYIYKEALPLPKLLSHIAINLNLYTDHINNAVKTIESPLFKANYIDALGQATNYINLRKRNRQIRQLLSTDVQYLKERDVQNIVNRLAKNLIDTGSFVFRSYVKLYLRFTELLITNLNISAKQAKELGAAARNAINAANQVGNSVRDIGKIFGSDIPNEVKTHQQLLAESPNMKFLLNPPVAPFAIANLIGGIPVLPQNLQFFVLYLVLETILLALEVEWGDLGGGKGKKALDILKDQLFEKDSKFTFVNSTQENFAKACESLLTEYLLNNPTVSTGVTTGDEYIISDTGREYVGEYHVHKDGTVMAGKNHETEKRNIILEKIIKRDDIEDA